MSCPRCKLSEKERRICIDVVSPYEKTLNLHSVSDLQHYLRSSETDYHSLRAAFVSSKLWAPNTLLTIGFIATETNPSVSEWQRAWVSYLVQTYIEPLVHLQFNYELDTTKHSNCTIRISFDPSMGCYSRIGTDALQNWGGMNESMNLGWMDAPYNHTFTFNGKSYTTPSDFDQGGYPGQGTTIIHEFGHVLGMIHEHQTPFGNPLTWNTELLYQIFEGPPNNWNQSEINANIIDTYSSIGLNGSNFDSNSIMKYTFPANLLKNPSVELANSVEKVNLTLSNCDKYWMITNYPGKVSDTELATYQSACSSDTETTGGFIGRPSSSSIFFRAIALIVLLALFMYVFSLWIRDRHPKGNVEKIQG